MTEFAVFGKCAGVGIEGIALERVVRWRRCSVRGACRSKNDTACRGGDVTQARGEARRVPYVWRCGGRALEIATEIGIGIRNEVAWWRLLGWRVLEALNGR